MGKIVRYLCIGLFIIAAAIGSFALPRRNLRTIAQVAGIALDEEKGDLRATFELFVPSMDQSFGKERETVSTKGKTLEECIKNIRLTAGKELYIDDASVLILEEEAKERLFSEIEQYYSIFANDHMDLPVFLAHQQNAGKIFSGKGKILSTEIAESARLLKKQQTVRDLLNGKEEHIYIKGEGNYEIIS